ncbi:MAG: hypothetical protein ACHP8A_05385 [Terriglobales bacterium]
MKVEVSASNMRRLNLAIVIAVLSLYSFPYLATSLTLKSHQVPFAFAPDLSLYLNLSMIGSSHANPYFGSPLQSGEMGYVTFDIAFKLLGGFVKIAGNNLWFAVFIWNLFWWTAMCIGALWFLRTALPQSGGLFLCLAMTLLFFFNFGVVKSELLAWLRLPSLIGFDGLTLPNIRTVFPQVPLALLFPYLALQVRAIDRWHWLDWAGMCLLQAAAFETFPYETLLMAGITLVAVLATLTLPMRRERLGMVGLYAAACAIADILFLFPRLFGGARHSGQTVIALHPERVLGLVGGGFLLLALVTAATALLPPVGSRSVKWTIAGLGFANCLLMLGDTVFSPALLVSNHAGYFIHTTISLQICYLVSAAFVRFGSETAWLKVVCLAVIVLTITNGLLLALASNRNSLAENRLTNEFATTIQSFHITKDDLVITRAESVDDLCAWVPLLTPAKVLFCRSAQYELSLDERRKVYRPRQAFYLYFAGKDVRQIELAATDSSAEQERLAFTNQTGSSDKNGWEEAKASIQTDLLPLLSEVEKQDGRMESFFSPYSRVLVVDDATNPTFARQRLASYFSIKSEGRAGEFIYFWCTPR